MVIEDDLCFGFAAGQPLPDVTCYALLSNLPSDYIIVVGVDVVEVSRAVIEYHILDDWSRHIWRTSVRPFVRRMKEQ